MTLQQLAEELKSFVASRQMTAAAAIDTLVSEAENRARAQASPAQIILRKLDGAGGEVEVKVDVNGADFDAASGLAKQLVARALAAPGTTGPTGPTGAARAK